MATNAYLKIYNNDGSTILFTSTNYTSTGDSGTVTNTGFTFTVNGESGSETYTYSGNKKFIGFATTANATEPEYAIGDTIVSLGGGISTLYIVEESPSGTTYEILYNDEVINTVEPGNKIEIHCAGDIMDYNIVVRPVVEETKILNVEVVGDCVDGQYFEFVSPISTANATFGDIISSFSDGKWYATDGIHYLFVNSSNSKIDLYYSGSTGNYLFTSSTSGDVFDTTVIDYNITYNMEYIS